MNASYNLENATQFVWITPTVTDPYGKVLTFGTDFTATLDGVNVTSLPIRLGEAGTFSLVITGTGDYAGSKTCSYTATGEVRVGNEDNPILINSASEWDTYANDVNNGTNVYKDMYFYLNADITVSTMMGSSTDNSFQGHFDGGNHTLTFRKGLSGNAFIEEYCAPFRYVKDATIQNLKVTGNIYTSRKLAGGLVARPSGTTTITGCHVSTVIHSSVNGDGTHGGIVARLFGTTNISGCVYAGRLFTSNGTTNCGGLVGWYEQKTLTFTNSLYAPDPSITPAANEVTFTTGCATIVRGINAVAGCYYTETMGTEQGSQVYSALPDDEICKVLTISSVTVYMMPVCTVSGVDASYLLSEGPSITPAVTYSGNALTFGTDYTATLNGESVASFPLSPDKMGTNTLILTGAGDYAGKKTVEFALLPSSTDNITLTDADTYTLKSDVNVGSATYTKTLGEERIGKHQAWFVPFDYTITADDLKKFTFYKINMIANAPDPAAEVTDDIWMFVKKMQEGDVLHANMPYVYKPKEAVDHYQNGWKIHYGV